VQRLAIGGGKEGTLFLLNRDNLGGNTSNDAGAVQSFSVGNRIFGTPAFWQNTLYITPITDHVKSYTFNASTGQFNTSPASQSPSTFGFPGSTPSISSQGTSNGIVWATERGAGPAVLHAYDATNLGTELWNSANSSVDQAGQAVKFTVPTVANGKVYVGTVGEISVYGLAPN
jgi:outer membrane protein assembly factor BamB